MPLTRWFDSGALTVLAWCCPGVPRGDVARQVEEASDVFEVFLQRQGGHTRRLPGRDVAVDGTRLACANAGEPFRLVRRAGTPERGTVLRVAEPLLRGLLAERDPRASDAAHVRFPADTVHATSRVWLAHHALCAEARHGAASGDPLHLHELALTLVRLAIHAPTAATAPRPRLSAAAREAVEATRLTLVARFAERLSLPELAAAVGMTPWHLSRVFRGAVGVPMHRYLVRLRLRSALDQLTLGEHDLSRLAHSVGFSSHSHFTSAFRREFGRPPSVLARARGGRQVIRADRLTGAA